MRGDSSGILRASCRQLVELPKLNPDLPSFRIGLLCRVCIGESRDGHAGIIDAHDPRIGIERETENLGWRYLRDNANIRNGRPVAVAEDPAGRMFGEQRLNRL